MNAGTTRRRAFPAAVQTAHPSWQIPAQSTGRDVGKIRNAVEQLKKAVRPPGSKSTFRSYEESDSVEEI
nr:hypothetical protein [Micromonospora sp. DSM 115978]